MSRAGSIVRSSEGDFCRAAIFKSGRSLIETGLHFHDSELAVFDFAMRGHGPEETDAMAGNGNVGMIAAGDEDGVAIADNGDELGILRVVVDELNAVGGIGHVEIDVDLFEHSGVLVGRPTGPVAWIGLRDTGNEAAGLDIFRE